ncbi:MAG: 2-oxoisovalerate dehydrogenase [Caldisericum sp.]|uniref:2-oxoisovalerate dehydrogenase n=1 Tax=Caldisericum sp. TaxID=2499687 RepID=UPI003D0D3A8B
MIELFFIVEESSDGGYTARALGESIFTEGETIKEIKEAIKDAVKCHFELEDLPKIIRIHFVKDEVLTI